MKLNMYCIYDTATGVYLRPFFMQSDGQATRSFKDIATDADHEIGKHPEDYSLHRIGVFDIRSWNCICSRASATFWALASLCPRYPSIPPARVATAPNGNGIVSS